MKGVILISTARCFKIRICTKSMVFMVKNTENHF